MKKIPRENRPEKTGTGRGRGFYYSLILHAALVLVFVVGIDLSTSTPAPTPPGEGKVMNVTAVDPNAVAREVEKLKSAETAKQREAERKIKEAEKRREKIGVAVTR